MRTATRRDDVGFPLSMREYSRRKKTVFFVSHPATRRSSQSKKIHKVCTGNGPPLARRCARTGMPRPVPGGLGASARRTHPRRAPTWRATCTSSHQVPHPHTYARASVCGRPRPTAHAPVGRRATHGRPPCPRSDQSAYGERPAQMRLRRRDCRSSKWAGSGSSSTATGPRRTSLSRTSCTTVLRFGAAWSIPATSCVASMTSTWPGATRRRAPNSPSSLARMGRPSRSPSTAAWTRRELSDLR